MIDFNRIKRIKEEMVARDYEGISTLHSGDVIELLNLTKEYRKLIQRSLEFGIDDNWRQEAMTLTEKETGKT